MSTNQHNEGVKLCASYWTLAGDVFPGGPSEISPFPIEDRIVAAGAAGWQAMGFILPDIVESIRRLGINEIRNLLYTNRIVAVELELLENWYLADGRRSADQAALETMLAIADSLPVAKIKIATGARGKRCHRAQRCETPSDTSVSVQPCKAWISFSNTCHSRALGPLRLRSNWCAICRPGTWASCSIHGTQCAAG